MVDASTNAAGEIFCTTAKTPSTFCVATLPTPDLSRAFVSLKQINPVSNTPQWKHAFCRSHQSQLSLCQECWLRLHLRLSPRMWLKMAQMLMSAFSPIGKSMQRLKHKPLLIVQLCQMNRYVQLLQPMLTKMLLQDNDCPFCPLYLCHKNDCCMDLIISFLLVYT